jgi:Mg-chelatase subunit ChlD
MPAVPVRALATPELPSWMTAPAPQSAHDARVDRSARGRLRSPSRSIDWFATLVRARSPRERDLRYRLGRPARGLLVLAIDCSASMLRGGALGAAKGVARACATHARRSHSELALIAFSGAAGNASRAACVQRSSFERVLGGLGAGGGTPLRSALLDALAIGRSAARRGVTDRRLLVLTDGRSRERVADLMRMRDTFDLALIDCERARVRLGGARRIARELRARYAHVDALERSEAFT